MTAPMTSSDLLPGDDDVHEAELAEAREELRRTLRRFLDREIGGVDVDDDGPAYDRALWQRLAVELGVASLLIPEEYGGAGYGPREMGIALEEAGRVLLRGPLLSTGLIAVTALLLAADRPALQELLPLIASGELTCAVAVDAAIGPWSAAMALPEATATTTGWSLTGTVPFVLDGGVTDLTLVPARVAAGSATGVGLFSVAGEAGYTRLPTMDLGRTLGRLRLDGDTATLLGPVTGGEWLPRLWRNAVTGLAAESVGSSERMLELSVDYAMTRIQFARPIGSFQAVKHRLADMLVATQSARSTSEAASRSAALEAPFGVASRSSDLAITAPLASAVGGESGIRIAGDSLQIFGGIGFTWDHPIHRYLKRAKTSQHLFGNPTDCRRALGDALDLPRV